jgi:Leucine-rich repeat (LRR) protein
MHYSPLKETLTPNAPTVHAAPLAVVYTDTTSNGTNNSFGLESTKETESLLALTITEAIAKVAGLYSHTVSNYILFYLNLLNCSLVTILHLKNLSIMSNSPTIGFEKIGLKKKVTIKINTVFQIKQHEQ